MPGIAEQMLEKYGEVRKGDPEKRIYSFPVVFFSNDISQVCETGFKSWKNGRLDRFSAVDPKDGQRHCVAYKEIEKQAKAKRGRAPKIWGGRPKEILRSCDPNDCDIFRNGECEHSATLYFRVPGVPTGSMFLSLTTKSIYSLLDFVGDPENPYSKGVLGQALEDFGKIRGLFKGKPLFWLSKTIDTIHRTDWLKGTQSREDKEIIHMTTPGIDTIALLEQMEEEAQVKALPAPAQDVKALPNPEPVVEDDMPVYSEDKEDESLYDAPDYTPEIEAGNLARVKELREELGSLMKAFPEPWGASDLLEWMDANGFTKDDAHDEAKLGDMVGKLRDSLGSTPDGAINHPDPDPKPKGKKRMAI